MDVLVALNCPLRWIFPRPCAALSASVLVQCLPRVGATPRLLCHARPTWAGVAARALVVPSSLRFPPMPAALSVPKRTSRAPRPPPARRRAAAASPRPTTLTSSLVGARAAAGRPKRQPPLRPRRQWTQRRRPKPKPLPHRAASRGRFPNPSRPNGSASSPVTSSTSGVRRTTASGHCMCGFYLFRLSRVRERGGAWPAQIPRGFGGRGAREELVPGVVAWVLLLSAFADTSCVGVPLRHRPHPFSLSSLLLIYSALPLRLTLTPTQHQRCQQRPPW